MACAQLAASLRQVPGVNAVETSAAVGSVLVTYQVVPDAEQAFLSRLNQSIAHHGLSCDAPSTAQDAGRSAPSPLDGVAEKFVGAIVDQLVERSAFALVAALL